MHSDTQEHTQVDPKIIPAAQFSSLYPPLRLPKSKAKEINTQDFPPCVSLALPLDPMRRVSQPRRNSPNEGLETPSTKGLKRSYRERKCALTENASAIIPRASRRSYRQRRGDHIRNAPTTLIWVMGAFILSVLESAYYLGSCLA